MGREMNLDDDDDLEVDHTTFHVDPEEEGEDGEGHVWQGADELGGFDEEAAYDDVDLQQEPSEVGLGADMARYQDWR